MKRSWWRELGRRGASGRAGNEEELVERTGYEEKLAVRAGNEEELAGRAGNEEQLEVQCRE